MTEGCISGPALLRALVRLWDPRGPGWVTDVQRFIITYILLRLKGIDELCFHVSKHTNLCLHPFFSGQALRPTDTWSMRGWSWGSADPSPSFSSFPLCSIRSAPPPPFPFFPLPDTLLDLSHYPPPPNPQSTVPNVLPRAGKHLHHRLHQSASEVWRAYCAGVSIKSQTDTDLYEVELHLHHKRKHLLRLGHTLCLFWSWWLIEPRWTGSVPV